MVKRCMCGNSSFMAIQECTQDVVVDGSGDVIDECGVNVYESADGPFTCTACHAAYNSLDDLHVFPEDTHPPENEYKPTKGIE